MIFLEDKILELLNRKNKALSIQEIDHLLALKTSDDFRILEDTVNKMCSDYTIYRTNKGNYMTFDRSPLKKGILRVNRKGFGFVEIPDEEDIDYEYPKEFEKKIKKIIKKEKMGLFLNKISLYTKK